MQARRMDLLHTELHHGMQYPNGFVHSVSIEMQKVTYIHKCECSHTKSDGGEYCADKVEADEINFAKALYKYECHCQQYPFPSLHHLQVCSFSRYTLHPNPPLSVPPCAALRSRSPPILSSMICHFFVSCLLFHFDRRWSLLRRAYERANVRANMWKGKSTHSWVHVVLLGECND
jgi:hypothetical protein